MAGRQTTWALTTTVFIAKKESGLIWVQRHCVHVRNGCIKGKSWDVVTAVGTSAGHSAHTVVGRL